jgi:anti-anti-sigma factor
MEVREVTAGGIAVLEVKGRIDSTTAPALGDKLTVALASPQKRLIVDLSETDYVASSGLRVLLRAAEEVDKTKGKLVLHGLNSRVEEIFQVSGFVDLFTICKTRDEALGVAAA